MTDPDVHDYLDFRAFLRDWYEARRRRDPTFSRRRFARLAGRSSPGLFADVVEGGRRISPETARAFAQAMRLSRSEASFFEALVELGQAEEESERRAAWERIRGTRRFRARRRAGHQSFVYLASWWIPVVRELAAHPDFDPDPAWIVRRIRPPITEAQARLAIEALTDLGMLAPDAEGIPRPAAGALATPPEVEGLALRDHHEGLVELAGQALRHLPASERHLLGATVSVPARLLEVLRAELCAFRERVVGLCAGLGEPADHVVQLQLALFPVTVPTTEDR